MIKCHYCIIILSLFLPAIACEDIIEENVKNKNKWDTLSLSSYTYTIKRSCFCLPEYMKEAQVLVVNGDVVSASYLDSDEMVPKKVIDSFLTITEWFEKISSDANNDKGSIEVRYDNQLGYPVSIEIDKHKRRSDDELSVLISNVVKQ